MSPDAPKTQHRSVRISDEDWAELETIARSEGLDRAKVINQLVQWYLRRPKVKLPARPPRHDSSSEPPDTPS